MGGSRPMVSDDAEAVARLTTQLGYLSSAGKIATRLAMLRRRADDEVLVATGIKRSHVFGKRLV